MLSSSPLHSRIQLDARARATAIHVVVVPFFTLSETSATLKELVFKNFERSDRFFEVGEARRQGSTEAPFVLTRSWRMSSAFLQRVARYRIGRRTR